MLKKIKNLLSLEYGFLLYLLINIGISLFSILFLDCRYDVVDDFGLTMIASGAFGQEYTQCLIYSNSVLGWIIKVLNNFFRCNYYMIIQYILLTISSALFASIVKKKTNNIKVGIVSLLLWWGVFFGDIFINITYTTTAGVISFIGLIGLIVFFDNSKMLSVISLIIAVFGFMYRFKPFLLVLPFVFLYLVFSRKRILVNRKLAVKYALLLLVCIGLCIGVDIYTYRSNDWKEFKETNRLRELLQDYLNNYSKESINNGWNENDYKMFYQAKNDNKIKFGSDNLSKIVDVATRITKPPLEVLIGVKDFYVNTFSIGQMFLMLLLFIVSIFCGHRVFMHCLITHAFNIVSAAYFICQGRFPLRVANILLFCTLMLVYLSILDINVLINRTILIFITICACILMVFGISTKKKIEYDGFNIVEHVKSDKIHDYVFDLSATTSMTYCFRPIDTISTNLLNNVLISGGWTCPSPISENASIKFGGIDSFEVLSKRNDIYYIMNENEDITIVEKYLQENYDNKIKAKLIEKIGGGFVSYTFVHE